LGTATLAWTILALLTWADRHLKNLQHDPDTDRYWLQGTRWVLKTVRQACGLVGVLEITQLTSLEELLHPFELKALFVGVLTWQGLIRLWQWGTTTYKHH
jgi:hypothetical protein